MPEVLGELDETLVLRDWVEAVSTDLVGFMDADLDERAGVPSSGVMLEPPPELLGVRWPDTVELPAVRCGANGTG